MNPAFLHEIQRLVVAQVCDCFDTVKSSAADALAEVLASYIKEIGRAAHECADVAGRTDVNIGDVLSALDAVGAKFQTIVRDAESLEVPFAHALPARLQIKRLPKRAPAFREMGERAEAHIPRFLPALPDAHALRRSAGELAEPLSEKERAARGRSLEEPLDDVLGSLRKTHALTKKRRFGEFETRGAPGEVAAAHFGAWEAASSGVGRAASFASPGAPRVPPRRTCPARTSRSGWTRRRATSRRGSVPARPPRTPRRARLSGSAPTCPTPTTKPSSDSSGGKPRCSKPADDHAHYRCGVVCARVVADGVCWLRVDERRRAFEYRTSSFARTTLYKVKKNTCGFFTAPATYAATEEA